MKQSVFKMIVHQTPHQSSTNHIHSLLKPLDNLLDSVHHNNSIYKQNSDFRSENFVEPQETTLDSGDKTVYIPILETLKLLLSHEDILSTILESRHCDESDKKLIKD